MGLRRTTTLIAAAAAVVLTACSTSTVGPTPRPVPSSSQAALDVLNVLPPGATTGPSQRAMYDALNTVDPATLTDDKLGTYYKNAALDPAPGDVVSTETPRPGVTIKRDKYGVPFVYGKTDDDTAYGAGYAGTQDRMFVMDAIRYAGAGRVSELLGPTAANLATDADQLRKADYTPAEADAQLDALSNASATGKELVQRLDAFIAGVNAARRKLCPQITAATCPAPYRLLKVTPKPYTRADIVYAASIVGGVLGKGGGQEASNAIFLRQLQAKLGDALARSVLRDLQDPQDPTTPVTVSGEQPYGAPGTVDQAAVALPDLPGRTNVAGGTGGVPPSAIATTTTKASQGLGLPPQMSNAILVAASRTTTGRPMAVMGPQTAYQAPNYFDEIALHGPHYQARGVAFANLQFAVLIGRGKSYAWSATSASGDVIDTVLDRLCNVDGSKATIISKAYLDGTNCVPMTGTPHVLRSGSGAGSKVLATLPDLRTRHGIVQYRTTAGGVPVAVVSQRSTYGHEADSALGFAQMNDPAAIKSTRDFTDAFSKVQFTFNWFYIDTRDIATFTSGALPIRAKGVDPDLPRWGDRKWDWTGLLATSKHPQQINPSSGYLVSWNNKPSIGTYSADEEWGWGPVQRVLTLRDRVEASIKKGKVTRADVTADMIDAATVDVRGAYVLKDMLGMVGDDPTLKPYTDVLAKWVASGAHRVDRDRTGHYSDQAAVALMDAWYPLVAEQVLRPVLGNLVDDVPTNFDNTPSSGRGSAWNNVGSYQWVARDLRAQLGESVPGAMTQRYCGNGQLAACRRQMQGTLKTAVATLTKAQKTSNPAKWTYEKSQDDITFMYVGDTVAPIDWQNRSTFQQVIG
jgi:acyl-homoserine lactone acylase PvdQ